MMSCSLASSGAVLRDQERRDTSVHAAVHGARHGIRPAVVATPVCSPLLSGSSLHDVSCRQRMKRQRTLPTVSAAPSPLQELATSQPAVLQQLGSLVEVVDGQIAFINRVD